MHRYVDKKALSEFTQAIRANDLTAQMRIIAENLERSQGVQKAYWLSRRALLRMRITGEQLITGQNQADVEEATRLSNQSIDALLTPYVNRAFTFQQVAPLGEIPKELRVRIWKEGFWHAFWFWRLAANFHWLRRRWYQTFRAYTRAIEALTIMPDEEREPYEGWYYVLYSGRARAALRCGRSEQALVDLARTEAMMPTRPHLHPWHKAMAAGDVALYAGDYAKALAEVHTCVARLAELQMKLSDWWQVELDLLAARIARAQGNRVAFEGFCEKALTLCLEKRLPMSEAHVRAILQGEPY
ncbi:MAG TPA: hypothetical protein VNT75_13115 [Symbiobacteriaceae bacterium]|nr:hypothetical protein [Symbiobacteriaceae bacterium]